MSNKLVLRLLSGFLAILVLLILVVGLKHSPNLSLSVAPGAAKITVDNSKRTLRVGNNYLAPGTYTIRASFGGFSDASQKVVIPKTGAVAVNLVLNPNSTAGDQYLANNPAVELLREQLGGKVITSDQALIRKNYPIISLLPQSGQGYTIDYGSSRQNPSNKLKIALYITFSDSAAQTRALNWIRFEGYNPIDYEIIYNAPGATD